ncbi:MAG TPA: hypothetical protein VNP97_12780 [Microbacterium sp.]|nr:hypothetical protein [Microbacterium sp.]
MDVEEGSIRRLQRIAYGADATPVEREQAVNELARLAVLGTRRAEAGSGGPAEPSDEVLASDDVVDDASDPVTERPASHHASRQARPLRWALVAGALGLVVGGVLGWGVGQRMPTEFASPSAAAPSESGEPGTPLEETGLLRVFDRLPLAAESGRVASVDEMIDPESVRLLATRVDGPAAHLARTSDGENVCLVLLMPVGPARIECTVDGRLPADGLKILYGAEGYGLAAAELDQSGTVSLGLVGPS